MELYNIPYKIFYRDVKYPRLEFKTGELIIILPFNQDPYIFLNKHKDWIRQKFDFIKMCKEKTKYKKIIPRSEKEFRTLIYSITDKVSKDLDVELNHIYFRRMKTKWASLSTTKNLTINLLMKYLPYYMIKYIVFHELVHIIEKRHNNRFWNIISRKFKNYQEIEKEMFIYWFLIHSKEKKINTEIELPMVITE